MYEMGEDTLEDQLIMRITPLLTSTEAFSSSSFVINFIYPHQEAGCEPVSLSLLRVFRYSFSGAIPCDIQEISKKAHTCTYTGGEKTD